MKKFWRGAAYTTLSIHIAFIFFIVLTPFAILIGKWQLWFWTQNQLFRNVHLFLLTYVIVEVLFSIPCFLTTIENNCRKKSNMPLYSTGFFDYWVENICAITYRNWMFMTIFTVISIFSFVLYFTIPPLSS
ncbi:DUF2784 domain-containing protein [Legionella gresilensis]|uniref:DUF2784 domain-containing protein n=1 Tax=Legionella gresilensis TaxID=91823 RepID=UPI001040FA4F